MTPAIQEPSGSIERNICKASACLDTCQASRTAVFITTPRANQNRGLAPVGLLVMADSSRIVFTERTVNALTHSILPGVGLLINSMGSPVAEGAVGVLGGGES